MRTDSGMKWEDTKMLLSVQTTPILDNFGIEEGALAEIVMTIG